MKLTLDNKTLSTEHKRLSRQLHTQDEDREFLIKQLVSVKKENAKLRHALEQHTAASGGSNVLALTGGSDAGFQLTSGSAGRNSPSPARLRLAPVQSPTKSGSAGVGGGRSRSVMGHHPTDSEKESESRPRSASSQTSQTNAKPQPNAKAGASPVFFSSHQNPSLHAFVCVCVVVLLCCLQIQPKAGLRL